MLRGLDLEVPRGSTALLGPNGAGKTTLLRTLVGLLRPAAGSVVVCGADGQALGVRERRAALGFLPQETSLPGGARARDVVRYAAWLQRVADPDAATALALRRARVEEVAADRVDRLSGGTRRRVLLACAIVHDPQVVVLDEPAAGLDPLEQRAFRDLVADLGAARAVLLSTHALDEAAEAERVVVLRDGQVVAAGPVEVVAAGAPSRAAGLERALAG